MENEEQDEVKPLKHRRNSGLLTDRVLAATGILLAAASAMFPWYVFFNEDKFGIRVETMDHTRDLPDTPARNVFSVSPLAMVNRNPSDKPKELPDPIDGLTTATVSSLGKEPQNNDSAAIMQPMPGKNTFRLMHVANGRAMIEDSSGMYMVRIGSILPDNSRLATIEQRDGRWVIVTSNGDIVTDETRGTP
ncbi:flagellar protein [Rhizobium helianthi]|uniref:Flagellar protein n=1 Tax=Rhizobium helianthi TaxID=1132695 RepID=A0ABW4M1N6_9HYPH